MRPGLEGTLMRTINRRYWYDDEYIMLIQKRNLKKRYDYWITTEQARKSASNAIRECYLNYKRNKENCYRKLNFIKINHLSNDIIEEICYYL